MIYCGAFVDSSFSHLLFTILLSTVMCTNIRVLRNFINWKVKRTYIFTVELLLAATFWLFVPYKHWALWVIKMLFGACFGPWIKLVDELYIRKYYRTKEDLLRDGIPESSEAMKEDIANRLNIFDPMLKSSWVRSLGTSGRIVVEVSAVYTVSKTKSSRGCPILLHRSPGADRVNIYLFTHRIISNYETSEQRSMGNIVS